MTLPTNPDVVSAMANKQWAAACPGCAQQRILWPVGQNVSTGREGHATYVHVGTGTKECE